MGEGNIHQAGSSKEVQYWYLLVVLAVMTVLLMDGTAPMFPDAFLPVLMTGIVPGMTSGLLGN